MGGEAKDNHGEITLVDDLRQGVAMIRTNLAERGATFVDSLRRKGRGITLGAVDAIDNFAHQEQGGPVPKTTTEALRHHAAVGARNAIELAKQWRLIDPANIQKLPKLMDDEEEDMNLKAQIVDHLNSGMGTMATFYDVIVFTSNICFNKGITQANLTRFFESERVLKLLLQNVFEEEDSAFRSPNGLAFIGSLVGAISSSLKPSKAKEEKKKIDEDTQKDIEQKLKTFREKYDPESKYTVGIFISRLKAKYEDYDLNPWLEKQMPFFIEMLRGFRYVRNAEGEKVKKITGTQHVKNMVQGAYREKTKDQNLHEEFIRTHLGNFFHLMGKEKLIEPWQNQRNGPCFMIDVEALIKFFRRLKDLKTRETSEGQMIDLITKICSEETKKYGSSSNGVTLLVHKDTTAEVITITDPKDIDGTITDLVDEAIKVSSPNINNQHLLVSPEGIPERIIREYETMFDGEGELKPRAYNRMLKNIFEHREEDVSRGEKIDVIRRRVSELFTEVNNTLNDIFTHSGVKMPKEIEDAIEIDDYSELIRIARTGKNKRERYAARLKMELTWLTYRCSYTPRFVFRESDSRRVKAKMEGTPDDIQIDDNDPLRIVKFLDHEDGQTELIKEGKPESREVPDEKAIRIGEINLIPAKIGGQNCYLLHNGNEKTPRDYINLKSLSSVVINRIRERNMIPEEVTDMIRMAAAVDTIEELMALKENVGRNSGGLIKWEDTYTEEDGLAHIKENESKSRKYRTLRAVFFVPVFDGDRTYLVPFEVIIKLLEDVIKEKSEYNEIGHRAYEQRRRLACIPIVAPRNIFPELYEEEKNPHDLSDDVQVRVRQVLSTVSSEYPASRNLPKPSLPASL